LKKILKYAASRSLSCGIAYDVIDRGGVDELDRDIDGVLGRIGARPMVAQVGNFAT